MSRNITGSNTASITLTDTADNPVLVSGTIAVASGVALIGTGGAGFGWVIGNTGTISAGAPGNGISLGTLATPVASGIISNATGGLIYGASIGIFVNGPATVTNMAGGTISAHYNSAIYLQGAPGTVINGGLLQAGYAAVLERSGGMVTNLAGATISGRGGVRFNAPGTLSNAGMIATTSAFYSAVVFGATSTSNLLIVDPAAVFNGKIAGGNGVVELTSSASSGVLLGFGTTITNFSALQFDAGARWTISGNASSDGLGTVSIDGFTVNDTIDLTGFAATSSTFANNALVLTDKSSAHATLNIVGAFGSGDFQTTINGSDTDITIAPACYAAGTRILTELGEVPIEQLRAGDRVRTISGALQPIVWIGHRTISLHRHPARQRFLPIRVAPHAFGHGVPRRELILSPDHAVFVDQVLIPIRHLVNGGSVAALDVDTISYFHLALASHDVVLAEGMPAETYLEAGSGDAFGDADGVMRLHRNRQASDHCAMQWETHGYAPLVMVGAELDKARGFILP